MIVTSLDSGSSNAGNAFSSLYRELNERFAEVAPDAYSGEIDCLCPVLRVSGEVTDFGFRGFRALKLIRKLRVATFDVGIPMGEWEAKTPPELRQVVFHSIDGAVREAVAQLEKQGFPPETKVVELLERVGKRFVRPG